MRALRSTASASLAGFVIGVTAAFVGSILALVVPPLRAGIDQLATILHAMPVIALAPLFIVTLGRERTPTAIAALAAGFAMFVASTAAIESARPLQQDLFTALGSGRLRPVRQPASSPPPSRDWPTGCASPPRRRSSAPCSASGSGRHAGSAC